MTTISRFAASLFMAMTCLSAFAFDFPKLNLGKGNSLDVGGLVNNIAKATRTPGEDEEIGIGQQFASTLLGAKPLVDDAKLQRYVNVLGRWLAIQTERPDLPWTFGVLDDEGFNAFATPGGYIFVTKGLVNRMRNEAELAGVLAHEIAHVLQKHHLSAVKSNAGFAAFGDIVSAKSGANEHAKSLVKNMVNKLYASGLDKSDEYEADRLGVVIAARAGYDAFGLPAVLQMLQAQNAKDNNFSLMFKTHPAPSARIEMLDKLMADRFDEFPGTSGDLITVGLKRVSK